MDDRFVQPDGDKIRRLRQDHFWSQEQLADKAELRKRTIERAETGARLQRSTLRALAQALGCPPDTLILPSTSEMGRPPLTEGVECPYRGLKAFDEQHAPFFFGRDREVEYLVQSLRRHPFIAVIGRSGCGKSSLVFAGLIPALRKSGLFGSGGWMVRTVRPGETPLKALKIALGEDLADLEAAVQETLSAHPHAQRMLLVVDQFEDVFTLAGQEAIPFQELLLRLIETADCYVVLTVRADFYADLMESPLWIESKPHRLELDPLDEAGLRDAIIMPAANVGVSIEAALVERLVTEASGEPGVLPLIQETMVLLWERLEQQFLPLRAYESLALVLPRKVNGTPRNERLTGLQIAIARLADATLATLSGQQQIIARRIFLRLIHFGGGRADTRHQQPVDALRAIGDDPIIFEQTLYYLANSRMLILNSEEDDSRPKVDIAHEALISGWPTLRQWINEYREAEQTRRRLVRKAEEWVRFGKGSGGLLDEVELVEAERWLEGVDTVELGYDETLHAFVTASSRAIQEGRQREVDLSGIKALQQFEADQLGALLAAMHAAQGLRPLVKNPHSLAGRTLRNSSTVDPISALQHILDQIQERNRFQAHSREVVNVRFSPDGKYIATVSHDTTARLWDLQGTIQVEFVGHQDGVKGVSFSPDGQYLATASDDTTARLWDLQGKTLKVFRGHQAGVKSLSFSPDGQYLATASDDTTARLWDLQGKTLKVFRGHRGRVRDVSFSPDGQYLATASDDTTARLWDLQGRELMVFNGHQDAVRDISFSPDGQLLATVSYDTTARLWDLQGGELMVFNGHEDRVISVSFSPDGQYLATASDDTTARLWDLQGRELKIFRGHQAGVKGLSFSPDGQFLATASQDCTVWLWDLQGRELKIFRGHQAEVKRVCFSPDGQLLATASKDGTARLWDLQGGEPVVFNGHDSELRSICFSPDGQLLATASIDRTVRLWNIHGEEIVVFRGHKKAVWDICFNPDGRLLASASDDGTVKLWKSLDALLVEGCNWLRAYLNTNSDVKESDRKLCEMSR